MKETTQMKVFVEGSMSSNYHNTVFLLQIVFASSPLTCNFNEQEVVVLLIFCVHLINSMDFTE